MKVEGLSTLKRTATVTVTGDEGKPVSFQVRALPLGFSVDLMIDLPLPNPPEVVTGYKSGEGQITKTNDKDPKYLAALEEVTVLQLVAAAHYALGEDPRVTFTAKRGSYEKAVEFYRAVRDEMRDFGLTTSSISQISSMTTRLARIDERLLDEAGKFIRPDEHGKVPEVRVVLDVMRLFHWSWTDWLDTPGEIRTASVAYMNEMAKESKSDGDSL